MVMLPDAPSAANAGTAMAHSRATASRAAMSFLIVFFIACKNSSQFLLLIPLSGPYTAQE